MSNNLLSPRNLKVNVRLRDFVVDFMACLIPGFIVLSLLSFLFVGISILLLTKLGHPSADSVKTAIYIITKLHTELNLTIWVHIAMVACSYSLGFLLFRQDPKKPDYTSYIKNRSQVYGYNDWVIPRDEGLSPKDVQFPYTNLSEYLKHRGFENLSASIYWSKEKNRRSKAFINQLKTRISFYFPDSTFQIIKNEAHIRFSSSMWYGMKLVVSSLYLAIVSFLIIDKNAHELNSVFIVFLITVYISTKLNTFISRCDLDKLIVFLKKKTWFGSFMIQRMKPK